MDTDYHVMAKCSRVLDLQTALQSLIQYVPPEPDEKSGSVYSSED